MKIRSRKNDYVADCTRSIFVGVENFVKLTFRLGNASNKVRIKVKKKKEEIEKKIPLCSVETRLLKIIFQLYSMVAEIFESRKFSPLFSSRLK